MPKKHLSLFDSNFYNNITLEHLTHSVLPMVIRQELLHKYWRKG